MLELHDITRSFDSRRVLHDVGFGVAPGKLTGFVGANGAGKTTTMRIILGVLSADSGTVTLDGAALTASDRRRFGYMPEERGLYPKMRLAEQLTYLARLHGCGHVAARANARALLERLGLAERADDPVEKLSLGNQQRAQIAAALVHDPAVLVLDEPFSGLDPLAVETVQTVLKEYAARGVPVLFSSHQLDIVERICDDLVIIADGEVRAAGSRAALRAEYSQPRYELLLPEDAGWIAAEPGVAVVHLDDGYALFEASPDVAQRVLHAAIGRGPVAGFSPLQPSLAQIFREVVG
ncbi:MAG TPA: ATP-binding cassette domain-containing protein [Humibacter sp.]|nr:ATP-binding cassette domain-containing protein [Humibacter sp.]